MKATHGSNFTGTTSRGRHAPRRGIALLLVLTVVGLASIIGFAMLSSSALQAQASQNASRSTEGNFLAESGLQAALYYLQHPARVPPGWDDAPGYYIKATNQSLENGIPGTFDLEVKPTEKRDVYGIRAVARSHAGAAPRTVTTVASVQRARIQHAGIFGGNITIPLGVYFHGSVQSDGLITDLTGLLLGLLFPGPIPPSAYQPPSAANINYYGADQPDGRYTMPDGTVGYAQRLLSAPAASPVANADNPGRVFYYSNPDVPTLVMSTPVAIHGTLVVKGGGLSVRASPITINPVQGMPALIVDRDLNIYRTNVDLIANGVVWLGQKISWTGLLNSGSSLEINGSLLMPAGGAIDKPYTGGVATITFDSARVQVPDLTVTVQPGTSVKLLSWSE